MEFRDHLIGNECSFRVPKRYVDLDPIGSGAHGTVCSADDLVSKQKVAIKKLLTPFESKISAHRVYRELTLMKHCLHPNIIRILDVFVPDGGYDNIYIVMEYMEYSLADVIRGFELAPEQISSLTYQLVCGLKFLQSLGIMHRDLKPANVGVNKNLDVKILDFGLARADCVDPTPRLTYYIVTRYYRAPEVILGLPYDDKVDIWSLGCILGQMLLKEILFMGDDEIDQWHKITKKLGTPPPSMLSRCSRRVREFIENKAQRPPSGSIGIFEKVRTLGPVPVLENIPPDRECSYKTAADCLSKMLKIDPRDRVNVTDLLEDPFLQMYRWTPFEKLPDEVNLEEAKKNLRLFDTSNLGVTEWKDKVYELITTTWQSSLAWNKRISLVSPDGGDASPGPRQGPKPLPSDRDHSTMTIGSHLTVLSPFIGYAGFKILQNYFPNNSYRDHVICGGIIFISTLVVSRIIK